MSSDASSCTPPVPSKRIRLLSSSVDDEEKEGREDEHTTAVVLVDRLPAANGTATSIEYTITTPAVMRLTAPLSLLLDDIITDQIFRFVGTGHYHYVAGTNRQFRNLYDAFLQHKD
jgi:hypothetical protein